MSKKGSLERFKREVNEFSRNLTDREFVLFHKKIVLEALSRIVQKTPVDTGRARGNWQINIGAPSRSKLDAADTSRAPGDTSTTADQISKLSGLLPFAVVYISNNVEYIEYLEDGTSKQSPRGMVMVTIEELIGMFE